MSPWSANTAESSGQSAQSRVSRTSVSLWLWSCAPRSAHQGVPLNSTHILMSRGCPEQAGTGTPFQMLPTPSPRSPWLELEAQPVPSSNNPSSAPPQHSCTCASPPWRCLQKPPVCVCGLSRSPPSRQEQTPSVVHSWIAASPEEGAWPRTSILMKEVTSIERVNRAARWGRVRGWAGKSWNGATQLCWNAFSCCWAQRSTKNHLPLAWHRGNRGADKAPFMLL